MSPFDSNHNDDVEARLRRVLTTEAEMVNPAGDGLGQIRAGIDGQRPAWWRNPMVALAAAAVIGLALGAGAMVLNDDDNNGSVVADQPTATASASPSPTSSETPTPSDSPSPSQAAGEPVALPIYYVHDDGQGLRLYREFHSVPVVGGNRIGAALEEMFSGKATDPDYMSLWPKDTTPVITGKQGDTATVELSREATRANVGSAAAAMTIQQLVYTVTAADPTVKKVQVTVEGTPITDLWGHIEVGRVPFERADAVEVQGLVWLLAPAENATVGRTVQIKGVGTAFEGTISWEVQKVGGTIVEKGFTQGGANGEFAEFADTVTLPPGTYELRAFESSAEDGRPLHIDDKTFTVE